MYMPCNWFNKNILTYKLCRSCLSEYDFCNSTNHKQFHLLLEGLETEYGNLILHSDVRWLIVWHNEQSVAVEQHNNSNQGETIRNICHPGDDVRVRVLVPEKRR